MKKLVVVTSFLVLLASSAAFAEEVYVTKNGKKYHQQTCLLIKNKGAHVIDMKDAVAQGLAPCSKCFKDKLPDGSKPKGIIGSLIKSDPKSKK